MPEPVHIGEILTERIKLLKAVLDCQKKVDENPHLTVILAMIQMCLLEGDERDLAKWMSFYMMKKLEKDAGPELTAEIRASIDSMTPEEMDRHAKTGLRILNAQAEELFKKTKNEGSKDNG